MIAPLFNIFVPLFAVYFIHKLSRIIKQMKLKSYVNLLKEIAFPLFIKLFADKELLKKLQA